MPSPLCQVFNLMSLRVLQKSEYLTLAKMHPANCSSPQIYLTLKNLQILCYYASKPKFSYVATYFESFFPRFFFRREKRSCCNNKVLATRHSQQGQEGHKFAYLAKQYFASERERFRFL